WRVGLFVGLFPGAYLASLTAIPAKGMDLNYKRKKVFSLAAIIKAFVAGNALSVGAMVGGGCTTGAFMAAFPTLSLGSFAMAGTFFVVAMAWGFLLYTRDSSIVSELQSRGNEVYD
ncbi:MAG: YeeE/YedE family protein, partial [Bdellovibrionales bacterium]|nr:YeeE/YedE family protein [Bdellovibrionales bacterium]